ncbi:amylo-alpha-1,6-glucosidase [Thermococcus sp. 2319x1]|uniref:amylo-alpha-1,6-glucosidase n=1 Tax=Thermococcus sp. 2319x1 TaxID=1674923 RepID=UPI0015832623|nr:amylo-alpha-1,6-glucosidase [Thermococcus sp. 2319x1]
MRKVLSNGHLYAVFKERELTADFYAYDTLFVENLRLSLRPNLTPIDGSISRNSITILYYGDRVWLTRDIVVNNGGYEERCFFVNKGNSKVGIEGRYEFSTPFLDILERDYPQFKLKRAVTKVQNRHIYRGIDGRVRGLEVVGEEFKLTLNENEALETKFLARPLVEGTFRIPTFKSADIPFEMKCFDNEHYQQVYLMAINDLKSLIVDIGCYLFPLAGLPDFGAVFGRDSIWTAFFLLDEYPEIAKGVLMTLSKLQGRKLNEKTEEEPGKIPHEFRFGELCQAGVIPFNPYYGSVDSTPLYVTLAGEYLRRTQDRETIKEIRENLTRAVEWILRRLEDGKGYIRYNKTPIGLENQGWKDWKNSIPDETGKQVRHPVAAVEVQGYAYWALKQASELELTDFDEKMLNRVAENLKKRFNRDFWTGEYYGIALDGENNLAKVVSSNMGHLLITDILPKERREKVVEWLFRSDMFSGWGIRTLSSREVAYNPFSYHNGSVWPHDNAIIAIGLFKSGFHEEVKNLSSLIEACYRLGKIPELFSGLEGLSPIPHANSPQAWSAAGILKLLELLKKVGV